MKRTTILIVSLLITLAMALLILGSFHAQSLEQAIRLAESDFLWMVFLFVYIGGKLTFLSRHCIADSHRIVWAVFMVVTFLLNMSFPKKIDGVT
ncbi:hypothetical protein PCI56_09635 [Plesiomonas shigelloides subsp. oncorhynchi]|nr:hypothetical protein [Plesiomonas shigelloides]